MVSEAKGENLARAEGVEAPRYRPRREHEMGYGAEGEQEVRMSAVPKRCFMMEGPPSSSAADRNEKRTCHDHEATKSTLLAQFDEAPAAAAMDLDDVAATPLAHPTSRTPDKVEAKITRPGDSDDESPLSCLDFAAVDSSDSSRCGGAGSKSSIEAGDAADADASLHRDSPISFEKSLSHLEAAAAPKELGPLTDSCSTLPVESPRRGEAAVPTRADPAREGGQEAASDGDGCLAADGNTRGKTLAANAPALMNVRAEECSADGATEEEGEGAQRATAELEAAGVVAEAGIVCRSEGDETGVGQGPFLFSDFILPEDAMASIMGQLAWKELIDIAFVSKAWKTMALRSIKVLDLSDMRHTSVLSLSKAVHTMPGLEELYLPRHLKEESPLYLNAGSKLLRALGRHCPLLKILGAAPDDPFTKVPFAFSSAALEALLIGCPLLEDMAIGSMDPCGLLDMLKIFPGPALWPKEGVEVVEEGPDQEEGAEEEEEEKCREGDEKEGGAEEEEEGCRGEDEEEGDEGHEKDECGEEDEEEEGAEEESHHAKVVRSEGDQTNDGEEAARGEQGRDGRASSVEENAALAATWDVAATEPPLDALPLASPGMQSEEGNKARGLSGVTSLVPGSGAVGKLVVEGLGLSALKQVENVLSGGNQGEPLGPGGSSPVPASEAEVESTQPGASSPARAHDAVVGSTKSRHSRAILKHLGLVHCYLPAPADVAPSQVASLEYLRFTGCKFLGYRGGPVTGSFEIAAKATNLTSLVINHELGYVSRDEFYPTEEMLEPGRRRMELLTSLKMLRNLSLIRIHALDSIPVLVARELSALRSLHLECLYKMRDIAFLGELTQLTHLSLSIIGSSELPSQLSQLVNLEHLTVRKCELIPEVPAWIGTLTKLTELDLTESDDIRRLPRSIGQLANLQILRLCYCQKIRWLPRELGQLSQLSFLDISHTKIKGTTRLLRWLPDLEIYQVQWVRVSEATRPAVESGEESSDEDTEEEEEEEEQEEEGGEEEEEEEEGGGRVGGGGVREGGTYAVWVNSSCMYNTGLNTYDNASKP